MTDVRFLARGLERPAETVRDFEAAFARRTGRRWALATNSGSAALHLGLLALGIGRGDRVVVPSYVCAAVLNAVMYAGAEPVVADVSPDDGNMGARDAAAAMGRRRAAAVIVSHMFGLEAPVEEIAALGAPVLEDFTMTVGGGTGGRPAGSRGAASAASFYASKMMSTQQGGILLTDGRERWLRARDRASYDGRARYEVRFNYAMTGLAAALGLAGLRALDGVVRRRRRLAAVYRRLLSGVRGLELPPERPDHVYLRFVVKGPAALRRRLVARGVDARGPVHRPLHACLGLPDRRFPVAAELQRRCFCLPLYADMAPGEAERIARIVGEET